MDGSSRTPEWRHVVRAAVVAALTACGGDGPTGAEPGQAGVRTVAGGGYADTVLARRDQALVVEVRGRDGAPARGAVVRFEALPAADPVRRFDPTLFLCRLADASCSGSTPTLGVDSTREDGRAAILVRLGVVAGEARLRVTVPEFGYAETVTYTVRPGAPVEVSLPVADTTLSVGAQLTLAASTLDRYGNVRPEPPVLSRAAGADLDLDPATGVVTARDIGEFWTYARLGAAVDSARVRVVPVGRLAVTEPDFGFIRLVNLDGSDVRTVATGLSSDFGAFPRFGPSRSRIALHAGQSNDGGTPVRALVVDTAGGVRTVPTVAGMATVTHVREMVDGSVLFVGRHARDEGDFSARLSTSVWRANTDDTVAEVAVIPDFAGGYGGADLSPDGTRVAYVAATGGDDSPLELRVFDLNTGAVTVLDRDGRAPRWSADGTRIAYLDAAGVDDFIYFPKGAPTVIGADGAGRQQLSTHPLSPGLAWSPDGVYVIGRSDNRGLRVIRVADRRQVALRLGPDYYQPDWR